MPLFATDSLGGINERKAVGLDNIPSRFVKIANHAYYSYYGNYHTTPTTATMPTTPTTHKTAPRHVIIISVISVLIGAEILGEVELKNMISPLSLMCFRSATPPFELHLSVDRQVNNHKMKNENLYRR